MEINKWIYLVQKDICVNCYIIIKVNFIIPNFTYFRIKSLIHIFPAFQTFQKSIWSVYLFCFQAFHIINPKSSSFFQFNFLISKMKI